jgi:pimeloyl-ACP methyl ester carboxylesterase
MNTPVVLVHGWGGSFASTWRSTGFTELLADAGRPVIGVDLLGHGTAPKPHDPEAYADLGARIVDSLPDQPVDAIGFSLGAVALLGVAAAAPHRFRKLVLAGVGRNVVEPDVSGLQTIVAALEGAPSTNPTVQAFVGHARREGNDVTALAAVFRRPRSAVPDLAAITCPTLVIIGDRDEAGPGEPLVERLPNGSLTTLRNVDHFATPESFGFIDSALAFIGAVPE